MREAFEMKTEIPKVVPDQRIEWNGKLDAYDEEEEGPRYINLGEPETASRARLTMVESFTKEAEENEEKALKNTIGTALGLRTDKNLIK